MFSKAVADESMKNGSNNGCVSIIVVGILFMLAGLLQIVFQ